MADRYHARQHAQMDSETARRSGLLFASGLIAGEAIIGVLIAIPIVLSGRVDVLSLPERLQLGQWFGLAAVALIGWQLYRQACRTPQAP